MEGNESTLHRIIADLTRKNEQLEYIIDDLKIELNQTKALLQATRARASELNEGKIIYG